MSGECRFRYLICFCNNNNSNINKICCLVSASAVGQHQRRQSGFKSGGRGSGFEKLEGSWVLKVQQRGP